MPLHSWACACLLATSLTGCSQQFHLARVPSPRGVPVYGVACDSAGTVYASTQEYGLVISRNGGAAWTQASIPLEKRSAIVQVLWPLFVSPRGMLYAFSVGNVGSTPVLRSADGGIRWSLLDTVSRRYIGNSSLLSRGDAMFSLSAKGICRSDDDGITWRIIGPSPMQRAGLDIQPQLSFLTDSVILASGIGVLSRSSDLGATWHEIPLEKKGLHRLLVDTDGTSYLWSYDDLAYLMRRSSDGGLSWVVKDSLPHAVLDSEGTPDRMAKLPDGRWICGSPNGTPGVWIARDSMRFRWRAGLPDYHIHDLCVDRHGRVYAATHAGLYTSSDAGQSWTELNDAFAERPVEAIFSSPDSRLFLGTESGGLFSSRDSGETWRTRGLDGLDVVHGIAATDSNILVLAAPSIQGFTLSHYGIDFGGYHVEYPFRTGSPAWTTDGGASWSRAESSWCTSIVSDTLLRYYSNAREANYSGDVGAHWSTVPLLSRARWLAAAGNSVFASVTDESAGMRIAVVRSQDSVFRSDDGGAQWRCVHVGRVYGMWASGSAMYIHDGGTLRRSNDLGGTWQTLELPDDLKMTDGRILLRFQSAGAGAVYATSTWGGRVRALSTDAGSTWVTTQPGDDETLHGTTSCLLTKDGQLLFGSRGGLFRARRHPAAQPAPHHPAR